jgi:predicted nuclease of predicted toxin-antitoxin system
MKLLFDQNLSFKLARRLEQRFPGSSQVRLLGLDQAGDAAIWEYARQHDFVLVTQDGDYSNLSALRGYPPKVIWLRCGNRPTDYIAGLLDRNHRAIVDFLEDPTVGCLEMA